MPKRRAIHHDRPSMLEPQMHDDGPDPDALLTSLGDVVYFAQVRGGIIKIGFTGDLARRRTELPSARLLAFRFGTHADEQAIHARLVEHRARGREWYHPTDEVMAEAHAARDWMLSHVA